jgi:hypothetical protein
MEAEIRLVHWYDLERHRIACGAAGESHSTKHVRGVTCSACLAAAAEVQAATDAAGHDAVSYVH